MAKDWEIGLIGAIGWHKKLPTGSLLSRDEFMRRLAVCVLLLVVFAPWMVGCGGGDPAAKPVAQAPQAKLNEAASKEATATEAEKPKSQPAEPVAASSSKAEVNPSESAAPQATAPKSKPIAEQPKPAPVVKPTEEQLAKWERAPFEKLELLDCRDLESLKLILNVADARDGKHVLLGGKKVVLWSVDPKEADQVLIELEGEQLVKSLAVAPDGKWFAVGDSEGMLRIWSLEEKKEIVAQKVLDNDVVETAISPDGTEIAVTSYDGKVAVWSFDLASSKLEKKKEFKAGDQAISRLAYVAPGKLVAASEKMPIWDTSTGVSSPPLSVGRYEFTLGLSPDGKQFAFTDDDKLYFWNQAESKREAPLLGPVASKELLTFSSDGKWLATLNRDSIRIWDLTKSRQVVQYIDAIGDPLAGFCWLPQSEFLVTVSATGRARIWGTAKSGEALGLKPMHVPVKLAEANSKAPVTSGQVLQTVDLRSFPLLPECEGRFNSAFNIDYEAPVAKAEAETFYRHYLTQAGWRESGEKSQVPDAIEFRKNGLRLIATFSGQEAAKTNVSLNVSGNYDSRWAPKFAGAPIKESYAFEQTVSYSTKADLLTIETELLQKLHEAGWTGYSRLNASSSEEPDARSLDFIQNGMQLDVSIGKFPVAPDSYTITTSAQLSLNAIPVPKDSGFVEFDGSVDPKLVATTAMSLDETREFYDKALTADGWLPRKHGKSEKGDKQWLDYIRGQSDLHIGLSQQKDGRTLVLVGESVMNSSWQLPKPKPKEEEKEAAGIEASDFPILNESKTAKFDATGKSIEIDMGKGLMVEAGDKYAKVMKDLGWEQDGAGIKDEEYVFLTFKKGKAEVQLRARKVDGKPIFNVQGDGLLWTKDLPGGKQMVSYETWLKTNGHPAGLSLLPTYEKEMRAILNGARP